MMTLGRVGDVVLPQLPHRVVEGQRGRADRNAGGRWGCCGPGRFSTGGSNGGQSERAEQTHDRDGRNGGRPRLSVLIKTILLLDRETSSTRGVRSISAAADNSLRVKVDNSLEPRLTLRLGLLIGAADFIARRTHSRAGSMVDAFDDL
jgi:hypothetical protein